MVLLRQEVNRGRKIFEYISMGYFFFFLFLFGLQRGVLVLDSDNVSLLYYYSLRVTLLIPSNNHGLNISK